MAASLRILKNILEGNLAPVSYNQALHCCVLYEEILRKEMFIFILISPEVLHY